MHDHLIEDDRKPQPLRCYEGMVYMLVAMDPPHILGTDDADCESTIESMKQRERKELLGRRLATGDFDIVAIKAATTEPDIR